MGDHRARAGRAEGERDQDQVLRGRPVPLRRPHPEGRRADAHAGRRRARGRGHRGRGGRVRHPGQGRRPRDLLVHPRLRQVPVLRDRPPEPVRRRQERRHRDVPRRHVPVPPGRRGLRRPVRARHVLAVRGGARVLRHQDPRRDRLRRRRAGGLRRADRLGLGGARGRRARRADRGDLRRGRRGQQRGAGRPVRRGEERRRGGPGAVQAGDGQGVRRHAHLRHRRGSARVRRARPPGANSPTARSSRSASCTTR